MKTQLHQAAIELQLDQLCNNDLRMPKIASSINELLVSHDRFVKPKLIFVSTSSTC